MSDFTVLKNLIIQTIKDQKGKGLLNYLKVNPTDKVEFVLYPIIQLPLNDTLLEIIDLFQYNFSIFHELLIKLPSAKASEEGRQMIYSIYKKMFVMLRDVQCPVVKDYLTNDIGAGNYAGDKGNAIGGMAGDHNDIRNVNLNERKYQPVLAHIITNLIDERVNHLKLQALDVLYVITRKLNQTNTRNYLPGIATVLFKNVKERKKVVEKSLYTLTFITLKSFQDFSLDMDPLKRPDDWTTKSSEKFKQIIPILYSVDHEAVYTFAFNLYNYFPNELLRIVLAKPEAKLLDIQPQIETNLNQLLLNLSKTILLKDEIKKECLQMMYKYINLIENKQLVLIYQQDIKMAFTYLLEPAERQIDEYHFKNFQDPTIYELIIKITGLLKQEIFDLFINESTTQSIILLNNCIVDTDTLVEKYSLQLVEKPSVHLLRGIQELCAHLDDKQFHMLMMNNLYHIILNINTYNLLPALSKLKGQNEIDFVMAYIDYLVDDISRDLHIIRTDGVGLKILYVLISITKQQSFGFVLDLIEMCLDAIGEIGSIIENGWDGVVLDILLVLNSVVSHVPRKKKIKEKKDLMQQYLMTYSKVEYTKESKQSAKEFFTNLHQQEKAEPDENIKEVSRTSNELDTSEEEKADLNERLVKRILQAIVPLLQSDSTQIQTQTRQVFCNGIPTLSDPNTLINDIWPMIQTKQSIDLIKTLIIQSAEFCTSRFQYDLYLQWNDTGLLELVVECKIPTRELEKICVKMVKELNVSVLKLVRKSVVYAVAYQAIYGFGNSKVSDQRIYDGLKDAFPILAHPYTPLELYTQ
ncbi:hypothetical protein HK103_006709 [Boothiomyces macroporosus]|uniref:Uncharacterized protein n=1 Tax=Boothiomyces macroporosus TaxID=261099 RepID=A0AAD5Y4H4_9FUNG|nr:hypothetical protein HK103_006709 [Boothiomyces macroporosus]